MYCRSYVLVSLAFCDESGKTVTFWLQLTIYSDYDKVLLNPCFILSAVCLCALCSLATPSFKLTHRPVAFFYPSMTIKNQR